MSWKKYSTILIRAVCGFEGRRSALGIISGKVFDLQIREPKFENLYVRFCLWKVELGYELQIKERKALDLYVICCPLKL